jgi:L-ribulokinase
LGFAGLFFTLTAMSRTPENRRARYVIGVDFGTLSARAVLVDSRSGKTIASADAAYGDGVIDYALPGSKRPLPPHTALQNPSDYLACFIRAVRGIMKTTAVPAEEIVAIGTDFTSCTVLPVFEDGTPLCGDKRWRGNPHSWVKLWKHHTPQPQADQINQLGIERGEEFIRAYGGKYSSEWFFSKVLETAQQAPEVYKAADKFIEACDWIVWQLCGEEKRNTSAAGFKGMRVYSSDSGEWDFPSPEFFSKVSPLLEDVHQKLGPHYFPLSTIAGGLCDDIARKTGLRAGTPVCVGNIDAHAAVPACGVTAPGTLVMIMGTSTCHLLLTERRREVEGICGVVKDGVINGFWGYEAGQAGVGDLFAWHMEQALPAYIGKESRAAALSPHQLLQKQAAALKPGESGLLALDWWNGNRSVLVDADLSGVLLGTTIGTRPHEIYRALIEATAFGTRKIIEAFETQNVPINNLVACGGLGQKNPLLLQIYADVAQRPIALAETDQASALGAAMHAAVAAGLFKDMRQAAKTMAAPAKKVYRPNTKTASAYDVLYGEYSRLHDYFGRGENPVMKTLKNLKLRVRP